MLAVIRCRTFRLTVCYKKKYQNYYRTIILSVVLYVYETWPHTLREEHSLRVLENRVLRKIFGPKTDEVTGQWRGFMICTPYQIFCGRSRAWHVAQMRGEEGA